MTKLIAVPAVALATLMEGTLMFLMRTLLLSMMLILLSSRMAAADEGRGVIVTVSPDRQEIVVQVHGRGLHGVPMAFRVGKETRVLLGQQPADLRDLKPGQRVRVFYESRHGERYALGLTVRGGAPTAVAATPADGNSVAGVL